MIPRCENPVCHMFIGLDLILLVQQLIEKEIPCEKITYTCNEKRDNLYTKYEFT